jgi:hypothetical protein
MLDIAAQSLDQIAGSVRYIRRRHGRIRLFHGVSTRIASTDGGKHYRNPECPKIVLTKSVLHPYDPV